MTEGRHRIGVVAERAGVTTRTLRYYEELGLVRPSGYSQGGSRRYEESDLARILRIRELQSVMGFDLDEIGEILGAEDRLAELQQEYHRGVSAARRADILLEAARLNARTRAKVEAKIAVLGTFKAELEATAQRYVAFALEHDIPMPPELDGVHPPT